VSPCSRTIAARVLSAPAFRAAYCAVGANALEGSRDGERLDKAAETCRMRLAELVG
jgi:hypothetical protein